MPVTIGTQLGSHEIIALLGKGGMGEVYRARDTKLKRDVAIKILPDEFSRDSTRVSRFQREAEVLASLNHPNIGAIYDFEEAGEMRFLVLELVEGETLEERIQRGPIPVDEALNISTRISEALEAAHEKGVVHRDLKPANVKITSDGRVKVLDFGLAKAMEGSPISGTPSNSPTLSLAATQAGVILGTVAYMSPEQARGGHVDKRSDVWAFGVVLYEMLTGEQLFRGDTVSDTLAAVLRHEIDWKRVPAKAERLLRRCLERDPKSRLRDIGDMRLLLEDVSNQPVPSHSTWSRRLGLAGWAVAVGLLTVLGFAWWTLRSTKPGDLPLIRLNVDLGPEFASTGAFSAVLSPDGRKLVYRVHNSEGKYFLAVRPLDQDKESVLPQTENPVGIPFFSPDSEWIGFCTGGKLKKVPVQGGTPVELNDCGGGTGSWGEDGNIIASFTPTSGLSRIPPGGAKPEPVTTLAERELTHRYPQVLPGAKAVLFTAASSLGNFDNATIQVVSLKAGKPKTLITAGYFGRYVPSNGRRGHILYVHQRTLFAVPFDPERLQLLGPAQAIVNDINSSNTSGAGRFDTSGAGSGMFVRYLDSVNFDPRWQVLWLDSSGKTKPLVATPGTYGSLRLSPDGKRLAFYLTAEKGNDLYIYDSTLDKMFPLTFKGEVVGSPVWAPDGKHLAFRSKDGMSWIRADGGGEIQSLLPGPNTPSSFHPDKKRLAYYSTNPNTSNDIWILPLDLTDPDHPKPQKPEPFLNSPAAESQPAFSPDGRWIAYRASTGSDEQAIWVRPYPGPGGRWQIFRGGGSYPMWSQTSKQLFFERDDGQIMVVDYSVNGDSFIAGNPRLWSERKAFQPGNTINIDFAPDGKHSVILDRPVGAPQAPTHLTVYLNFFDELRRRAPEAK